MKWPLAPLEMNIEQRRSQVADELRYVSRRDFKWLPSHSDDSTRARCRFRRCGAAFAILFGANFVV